MQSNAVNTNFPYTTWFTRTPEVIIAEVSPNERVYKNNNPLLVSHDLKNDERLQWEQVQLLFSTLLKFLAKEISILRKGIR